MADKVHELEERLNRLEEKLKLTFVEIEKRLTQPQQNEQAPVTSDERIDELEDLILLMQLESTKLKEKVGDGLDFGITPNVPDVSERLNRMEAEIASHSVPVATEGLPDGGDDLRAKIAELEEKINNIPTTMIKVPKDVEKHVREALDKETRKDMHDMEKRIKTLEALLASRGREELEKESNVLADVHAILKR